MTVLCLYKQKQLVERQRKLQQRIQEREMELKDLKYTVAVLKVGENQRTSARCCSLEFDWCA